MLIDKVKIYVTGGNGGTGCQSLYKDLYNRRGTPDGGDGGNGGNVIVAVDTNLQTLLDLRYNQHHRAERGKHGGSNTKYGRRGEDFVVRVPMGTIIKDAATDLIVRDLVHPGETVLVAKGGQGGKGNAKRCEATVGELGEDKTLLLELKLVADVGIIGIPNAGKSTFVSRVTKAHSKIAPYPFTTKSPKLGVVTYHDETFVMADMPGLIEGAHEGRGLGDRFLRHIERTNVLVHMVDMFPIDETDPVENYHKLENELRQYDEAVYAKPRVVVANKMDITGAEENLKRFKEEIDIDVLAVSSATGEGIDDLVKVIYRKVKDVKEKIEEDSSEDRHESAD